MALTGLTYWIVLVVQILAGVIVTLLAALYTFQNKILYIPCPPNFPKSPKENPKYCRSPKEWNIEGKKNRKDSSSPSIPFEEAYIDTVDGQKIHVWLLLQKDSNNVPTLIYFHGNAANMGFRLENAAAMYSDVGINVLMMDYRGYGDSTGTPDEKGLNNDADAVLHFAQNHPKLTKSPLVAFGRSLGGAVSVALAHRHPEIVKGIVLENTFLSIPSMVDALMPWVSKFKGLILRIKWDSDNKISTLKQPILFISGDSDELVPVRHMQRLHELATNSVYRDFYRVIGGGHNNSWVVSGAEYYSRMKDFFSRFRQSSFDCTRRDVKENSAPFKSRTESHTAIPTMGTNFKVQ